MTLRGRLTTAFLTVVLGPVLLGAFFVGATVAAVGQSRSTERLDLATASVGTSVNALCSQLEAAAGAVALLLPDPARLAVAADQAVARGLASAVQVTGPDGASIVATADPPSAPWVDCASERDDNGGTGSTGSGQSWQAPPADTGTGSPDGTGPPDGTGGSGAMPTLAAFAEVRDENDALVGQVSAVKLLDADLVARLAASTGVGITLLAGTDRATVVHSTEPSEVRGNVVATAGRLADGGTSWTDGGRQVRRLGPDDGQLLPMALSTPRDQLSGLYAVLVATVVLAGLLAVVAAWWLARSTTQPLAELADAASRVVDGDLAARVPVRGSDEVSELATIFNRMTREAQAYVQALTASRDQLRGQLTILGDTLSSTHDLQRILRVILQTALAATGARDGAVLVLDPAAGVLVGQSSNRTTPATTSAGTGPAADQPAGPDAAASQVGPDGTLHVPLGSGLLGTVAVSGQPKRGRIERDGPALSAYEPACRTYVAVPFSVPNWTDELGVGVPGAGGQRPPGRHGPGAPAAFGVLAVYDRLGGDEFDDADLMTLRTFAGHAAVAVNNVRMHKEAERLSVTDPLTGLWNYRHLRESIHREIERANRFGRMLAVLVLDLDRFKDINDTYGHAAGDSVLVEFARRIRAEIREVDLAFRQGGEEFVVLLPETDVRGAATVAERLCAAIRDRPIRVEPYAGAGRRGHASVSVTVSIGIAVYPDHASDGEEVLDAADDALYAAKAAGRDIFHVADRAAARPTRVPAGGGAATPEGGPSRGGGASFGPHPPRQTRGR
ncbi:diguanylate cyclase (GGDEF)-like protein [Micromonospora sp. Llam0]|uniref:diguanylate cyclase n=1 Tax=Micromonospora sp. Llam0 TaxID=2485143 RepID=UPI000F4914F6|nr:diguanylate cyclase [Micromonospora sp. Llam0]ROO51293.1 diguanylate cyclase (GGDEF)-like protein [Micromonospora sp. Llam0]